MKRKTYLVLPVLFALILIGMAIALAACGGEETTTTTQAVTTTQAPTTATQAPTTTTQATVAAPTAASRPPGLMAPSMAYDPSTRKVILFGGWTGTGISSDTWAYDPATNTWTRCDAGGSTPPARAVHAMGYDPTSGKVILFGGMTQDLTVLNDTWAYDPAGNVWTELHPAGSPPSGRAAGPFVYDPESRLLLLIGGLSRLGDPSGVLNDIWAYDPGGNTWTELKPNGTDAFVPGPATAYDPVGARVINVGGPDASGSFTGTWAYDPAANAWTELKPVGTRPPARISESMVSVSDGRMIMFGGIVNIVDPSTSLNDTWAYDPVGNAWTDLKPSGNLPPGRSGYAMTYDPDSAKVVLFGGTGSSGQLFSDTWIYDPAANTWTESAPAGGSTSVPGAAKTYNDLAYATSSPAETLDLYLPSSGDGPFPVIVWIHGGAFTQGDKADGSEAPALAGLLRGYAVASVNYRLLGKEMFPAAVQDVKAAVRYLRANATKYGLDPDRIAAWGASAGGYFAAMLGTSAGVSSLDDASLGNAQQSSAVQAVIDWFGAIVVDPAFEAEPINPTIHITADDPPFLIEHGTADDMMPLEQSTDFAAALTRVLGEKKVTLKLLEGAGHGTPEFYTPENVSFVLDWLDSVLK